MPAHLLAYFCSAQCEADRKLLGTILLGASIAPTIHKKMIAGDVYVHKPDVLMSGMLTVLVGASFMVLVVTFCVLLISTMHTIVDSVTGFSITAKGFVVRALMRADLMHVCTLH